MMNPPLQFGFGYSEPESAEGLTRAAPLRSHGRLQSPRFVRTLSKDAAKNTKNVGRSVKAENLGCKKDRASSGTTGAFQSSKKRAGVGLQSRIISTGTVDDKKNFSKKSLDSHRAIAYTLPR